MIRANCGDQNYQQVEPDDPDDEDEFDDDAGDHCGMTPDGLCQLAGSEFCDFECPYRD